MHAPQRHLLGPPLRRGLLVLGLAALIPGRVLGQYHTTEHSPIPNEQGQGGPGDNAQAQNSGSNTGPVRLARFAYVQGRVSWRPDSNVEWAQAATNLPLRQGAQVWITNGGRADLQFDDGSALRIGNGSLLTLKSLYSDADGEFTQITLQSGLTTLATRHDHSVYQVDAPFASVMVSSRCKFRLGVDHGCEIAVRRGRCTVENQHGRSTLDQGRYAYLQESSSVLTQSNLPREDSWDSWNDERDTTIYTDVPTYHHVPANIALVSGELDRYGSWHSNRRYGSIWTPRVHRSNWRPYADGRWCWVSPYGWTWVATDTWGWAPYHYGTWIHESYGWGWCPGPVHQYWSPAVVSFSDYNGSVCWAPLAPAEVRYPAALSVGFGGNNWSAYFSIGQAGSYYPANQSYCTGRSFDNGYVNRAVYVNNITNITNVYNNQRINNRFVPYNARYVAGATLATAAAFGGRGAYRAASNAATYYTRGRGVGAPPAGRQPVFGPTSSRPTRIAMTPTRGFQSNVHPPAALARRATFRASAANGRPGRFNPAPAARPVQRIAGSFSGTRPGAPGRPGAPAKNAFNSRNTSGAAAANRARADLGMPGKRIQGQPGRPGGNGAPAQRRVANKAPANRPQPNRNPTKQPQRRPAQPQQQQRRVSQPQQQRRVAQPQKQQQRAQPQQQRQQQRRVAQPPQQRQQQRAQPQRQQRTAQPQQQRQQRAQPQQQRQQQQRAQPQQQRQQQQRAQPQRQQQQQQRAQPQRQQQRRAAQPVQGHASGSGGRKDGRPEQRGRPETP